MPSVIAAIDSTSAPIEFCASSCAFETSDCPEPARIPSYPALSSPIDHRHHSLLAPGKDSNTPFPLKDLRTPISSSPIDSAKFVPTDSPNPFSHSHNSSLAFSMSSVSDYGPSAPSEASSTSPSALQSSFEGIMPNTPLSAVSHVPSESHSSQASFHSRSPLSTDLLRRDSFPSSDVLHHFMTQRSTILKLSDFRHSDPASFVTYLDRAGLSRPRFLYIPPHENTASNKSAGLVMWAKFNTHEQALHLLKLSCPFNVSPALNSDLESYEKLSIVDMLTLDPVMKAQASYAPAFSEDTSTPVPQDSLPASHGTDDSEFLTPDDHLATLHKTPTAASIRPSSSGNLATHSNNNNNVDSKAGNLRPAVSMNDLPRVSPSPSYGTMNRAHHESHQPPVDLLFLSDSYQGILSRTSKPPTPVNSLLGYTLSSNPPPPKPTSFRQGDWICDIPGCGKHNFARNQACITCRSNRRTFPATDTRIANNNNNLDSYNMIPRLSTTAASAATKEPDSSAIEALGGAESFAAFRAAISAHKLGRLNSCDISSGNTQNTDRPTIPAANILTGAGGGAGRGFTNGIENENKSSGTDPLDFESYIVGSAINNDVPQLLIPTRLGGPSPLTGTSLPQGSSRFHPRYYQHQPGSSFSNMTEPKTAPFHSSATPTNVPPPSNASTNDSTGGGNHSATDVSTNSTNTEQAIQSLLASMTKEERRTWDFGFGPVSVVGREQFISIEPNNVIRMWWPDNVPLPAKTQIRPAMDPSSHPPILNTGNKGPAEMQPGDWNCRKCDYHNWRRRRVCARCYKHADNNDRHKEQPLGVSNAMQALIEHLAVAATQRGDDLTQVFTALSLGSSNPPENQAGFPSHNQGDGVGAVPSMRNQPSYASLNAPRQLYPNLPSPFEPHFSNSKGYPFADQTANRRPSNLSVHIPPRSNGPLIASGSQSEYFNRVFSPLSPASTHSNASSARVHMSIGGSNRYPLPPKEAGTPGLYDNPCGSNSSRSSLSVPRLSMSSTSSESHHQGQLSNLRQQSRQVTESVEEKTPSPLPLLPAFMHEMVGGEQQSATHYARLNAGWNREPTKTSEGGRWYTSFGHQTERLEYLASTSSATVASTSTEGRSRNPSPSSSSSLSNGHHNVLPFLDRRPSYQPQSQPPQSFGVEVLGESTRRGSSTSIWAIDGNGNISGHHGGNGHLDFRNRSISSMHSQGY